MQYTKLGSTEIEVSKICLGTMTWGNQNSEAEGHNQLDFATERGVNFIDTAELYAVPASASTYGKTEIILGNWLKKSGKRDDLVIASKIAGPWPSFGWIRDGKTVFAKDIESALNDSLKRLQTDYLDLYQLHWPERNTNFFGQRGYTHNPNDPWEDNIKETLEVLKKFVDAGKIKHIGLSNETPWGLAKFLEYSKYFDLPKVESVQNPYSLINRLYEGGLAEISIRENAGLLAYSPLGFGALTGKYLDGKLPEGARLTLFPNFKRYSGENSVKATEAYKKIAEENNISLTQLALAFVNNRPFVTSNIIGATNLTQLEENIDSINVNWTTEIEKSINSIHETNPNPAP